MSSSTVENICRAVLAIFFSLSLFFSHTMTLVSARSKSSMSSPSDVDIARPCRCSCSCCCSSSSARDFLTLNAVSLAEADSYQHSEAARETPDSAASEEEEEEGPFVFVGSLGRLPSTQTTLCISSSVGSAPTESK